MTQKIKLEEAVAGSRLYIGQRAAELGYELTPMKHDYATTTCEEKARLLLKVIPEEDWLPKRAVKMLFGEIDWEVYGFILPELGYKITPEIVENTFNQAGLEYWGGKFQPTKEAIPGNLQAPGVCTPFLTTAEMDKISGLFIHSTLTDYDQRVDISLGRTSSTDLEANLKSMLLPGKAIPEILSRQYQEKKYSSKIHIVDMPISF